MCVVERSAWHSSQFTTQLFRIGSPYPTNRFPYFLYINLFGFTAGRFLCYFDTILISATTLNYVNYVIPYSFPRIIFTFVVFWMLYYIAISPEKLRMINFCFLFLIRYLLTVIRITDISYLNLIKCFDKKFKQFFLRNLKITTL